MTLRTFGMIGYGAIGKALLVTLCQHRSSPLERLSILVRESSVAPVRALMRGYVGHLARRIDVTADRAVFVASAPELVVECAGHQALADHGPALLSVGIELVVVSVGALADVGLQNALSVAAADGGTRMCISSGAIGGVDIIAAAQLAGITELTYTSRKPSMAWTGSPAEQQVDLSAIKTATTIYEGTAREAARDYPKNANVAATLALAGPGMDATRVRLIADPSSPGNVHEFALKSKSVDVEMRIVGRPSPDNPRTSATTALSVAREVLNRSRLIAIG